MVFRLLRRDQHEVPAGEVREFSPVDFDNREFRDLGFRCSGCLRTGRNAGRFGFVPAIVQKVDRRLPADIDGSVGATFAFGRGFFTRSSRQMNALAKVRRFLVSEDGPTAVEYAVMLALILVACITIVTSLGTSASTTFSKVNSSLGS